MAATMNIRNLLLTSRALASIRCPGDPASSVTHALMLKGSDTR